MHDHQPGLAVSSRAPTTVLSGTALVVGRSEPGTEKHLLQSHTTIVACGPGMLDRAVLDHVRPSTVAFPLMAAGFDATLVVARLSEAGFSGNAIIFAPRLPNRDMVLRELHALAPGLTIRLVERQSD